MKVVDSINGLTDGYAHLFGEVVRLKVVLTIIGAELFVMVQPKGVHKREQHLINIDGYNPLTHNDTVASINQIVQPI